MNQRPGPSKRRLFHARGVGCRRDLTVPERGNNLACIPIFFWGYSLSKNVVVGMIRRFLQGWGKARRTKPSVLESTIMRVYQVQHWFLHNRGVPMIKHDCPACAQERMFTIWSDGKYRCVPCLYKQALQP